MVIGYGLYRRELPWLFVTDDVPFIHTCGLLTDARGFALNVFTFKYVPKRAHSGDALPLRMSVPLKSYAALAAPL